MRARSFSKVKRATEEEAGIDRRALREVVGAALVVFRPMPTTRS